MVFRPGGASLTRVEQENCCSSLCSLDVFQTLKGSLQTTKIWGIDPENEYGFKPSKDRYKHLKIWFTWFFRTWVSNPQRIATNCYAHTVTHDPNVMFQTLKGSLQTRESPRKGVCGFCRFKPSKDRYKLFAPVQVTEVDLQVSNPQRIATNCPCPRREHIVRGVSNPQRIATNNALNINYNQLPDCFKPSKDRYKPMIFLHQEHDDTLFQTLKGSLQTHKKTLSSAVPL